jgi:hypothetical protein
MPVRQRARTVIRVVAVAASLAHGVARAQVVASDERSPSADALKSRYLDRQEGLMTTLGAWSLGSIGTGAILWGAGRNAVVRSVGIQNVAWGAIDGAIALYSLHETHTLRDERRDLAGWQREQTKVARVFWINVGLDVLYVAVGAALAFAGKRDGLVGSGYGVMAQGGFLLTFDTAGAWIVGGL